MYSEFLTRLRSDVEFRNGIVRTWGLAIVVVALVAVVWVSQKAPIQQQVSLFTKRELSSDEIGLLQVAFAQNGLNDYEIRGSQIIVDHNLRDQFLIAADEHDAVPPDLRPPKTDSAFNILISRQQQHQANMEAKRRRIRDLVMQFSFVQNAKVEYDEAQSNQMFREVQKSASVTIQPVSSRYLENNEVQAIVDAIKGAVAGISTSDIVIVDTNANRSFTENDLQSQADEFGWKRCQSEEFRYRQKISEAIAAYPGVRVNVSVTFQQTWSPDPNSVEQDKTASGHQKGKTVESSYRMPNQNDNDGPENNAAGSNQSVQVPNSQNANLLVDGSFQIALVSVSIGVPEGLVRRMVQYRMHGAPTAAGLTANEQPVSDDDIQSAFLQVTSDIRQKILPLLPVVRSLDDQIVVTLDPEIPLASKIEPKTGKQTVPANFWKDNWKTLSLIGFGFAALIVLSIRTSPTEETAIETPEEFLTPIDPATMETVSMTDTSFHIDDHQYLKNEIEQWCQSNPDEAVETIRGWLEKAG